MFLCKDIYICVLYKWIRSYTLNIQHYAGSTETDKLFLRKHLETRKLCNNLLKFCAALSLVLQQVTYISCMLQIFLQMYVKIYFVGRVFRQPAKRAAAITYVRRPLFVALQQQMLWKLYHKMGLAVQFTHMVYLTIDFCTFCFMDM